MLLKGTDRTMFGTRRLVAIWRRPWTLGYDLVFRKFFLFSLVRHIEPTDQNCLDLFYQRKENKNIAFFVPETFKIKIFRLCTSLCFPRAAIFDLEKPTRRAWLNCSLRLRRSEVSSVKV